MQARAACPQKNIKQPDFIQRNPHRKSISTHLKNISCSHWWFVWVFVTFFLFFNSNYYRLKESERDKSNEEKAGW